MGDFIKICSKTPVTKTEGILCTNCTRLIWNNSDNPNFLKKLIIREKFVNLMKPKPNLHNGSCLVPVFKESLVTLKQIQGHVDGFATLSW